jgi:broad specificity phosphatase PhoE
MLKDAGVTAIYSTDTERTRDTVQPLAAALGLKVVLYDKAEAAFAARMQTEQPQGIVLVSAHSNTIPDFLKVLGCPADFNIEQDEYDNLFVVTPSSGGSTTLIRLRY